MLKKDKTKTIKIVPASGYKTQAEWMQYFSNATPKQRMISTPDVHTVWQEGNEEYIAMLIKVFKDIWLNTSSQVEYNPNNLSVTVIHNAGTKRERRIRLNKVPHYDGTRLDKVIDSEEGLSFLNALFETEYDADEMTGFLEDLSKKKAKKIWIWTPSQKSRSEKQIRSVDIGYYGLGGFDVDCDDWGNDGSSFGVISDSEPKARSRFSDVDKDLIAFVKRIKKRSRSAMDKHLCSHLLWILEEKVRSSR